MKSKYKRIKLPDGSTRDEHRIIMEEILGRKLDYNEVVHHKDGNGRNNDPDNLELMTRSNHSKDHFVPIKIPKEKIDAWKKSIRDKLTGSKGANSKLKESDVLEIRRRLDLGERGSVLAREYGVKRNTISQIKTRVTWNHI